MLRIISANLNGIRSAAKKGFMGWLNDQSADFICVQELKAQQADLGPEILSPPGLHAYFHHAQKKGTAVRASSHPIRSSMCNWDLAILSLMRRVAMLKCR